jgi:hypothetical protein
MIPAALSALKLLTALCVRLTLNAAPVHRSASAVPLLRSIVRVGKCSCD